MGTQRLIAAMLLFLHIAITSQEESVTPEKVRNLLQEAGSGHFYSGREDITFWERDIKIRYRGIQQDI